MNGETQQLSGESLDKRFQERIKEREILSRVVIGGGFFPGGDEALKAVIEDLSREAEEDAATRKGVVSSEINATLN